MIRPRPCLALAAALAALPALAGAPAITAPLGVTTPGPLRQLFLDPVIADARAVDTLALDVRLETGNNWSVPTVVQQGATRVLVQTDDQSDALVLALRIPWSVTGGRDGWRGRVATTLSWRLTAFWGGFEDPWIEAWHHLIGSTNFLRDQFPQNQIHLHLQELGGPPALALDTARVSPGDVVLATQALLASGGGSIVRGAGPDDPAWAVAARLEVKLPTGALDRAGGSGGVDAALSVLGTFELAPWAVLHARLSGSVVSPLASSVPLQPNAFHWGAEVSAVFPAGDWAFVIEDRALSPLFGGDWTVIDGGSRDYHVASAGAALFWVHNQISGGVRYGPVTLTFSEDFTLGPNPWGKIQWFYDSNAPDVVVGLTVHVPL